jgi:hypothetical protein
MTTSIWEITLITQPYSRLCFFIVYSPEEKDAILQVGSDEGLYVYLNSTLVYSYSGIRTYNYISDTPLIHLKKGYNTLLIKTLQTTGNHDFTMNICKMESNPEYAGNRVDGLKFYPVLTSTDLPEQTAAMGTTMTCSPNPASSQTTIYLHASKPGQYRIIAYDLKGRPVINLFNGYLETGTHAIPWNWQINQKKTVSPGIYLIKEPFGSILKLVLTLVGSMRPCTPKKKAPPGLNTRKSLSHL